MNARTRDDQPASSDPAHMLQQALRQHRQGDYPAAESLYRQVITVAPEHPDALHLLGLLCHQTGRRDEALDLLQRARRAAPDNPDVLCNLGLVQHAAGKFDDAEASLRRAISLAPDLSAAHNNLGSVRLATGDVQGALDSYRTAVRLDRTHVEALVNLANACMLAGRPDQGKDACAEAIRLQPQIPQAHAVMGNLLASLGDQARATDSYRRAHQLAPGEADHACSLASSLEAERRWDEALPLFEHALEIDPDHGPALSGALLLRRSLCQWDGLDRWSQRFADGVRRGLAGLTPFIYLSEPSTALEQLECARLWSRDKARSVASLRKELAFRYPKKRGERITVAYFSYDFRRHPTAYTKVGLFENHDRDRFRVLGYCNGPDDDSDIRRRVIGAFDQFADVRGWPPAEVAKRIHADGVDILVDLKGHTLEAPTEVFALRPAPVQVNYKGYPGTMGADFIDYIVADRFVVPEKQRASCAEKVVYLPETYWVDDRRRAMPSQPRTRDELGLPEDGFVFCGFNNSYKLTPQLFDVWADIVKAVPRSVLWLQNSNPRSMLADNLRAAARQRDLDLGRLVFAPRLPLQEYLALFRVADLFLDARPYNAHTTASDALWSGLPVLTCPGETFASRVAGSLLRTIGIPELVADGLDDYKNMAVALATDKAALSALVEKLGLNRLSAPLYDTARLTRHMEAAYTRMYEIHMAGEQPSEISVAPLEHNRA